MSTALQTAPRAADGSVVPWFLRLMEASPLSSGWTAVCIGAGIILTHVGVVALSSGAIPIDRFTIRLILQFSLMNAYGLWAAHFVAAGAVQVLADLRPVLRGGAEAHVRIVRSMIHVRPAEMILPAVAAIAFAHAMNETIDGRIGRMIGDGPFDAVDGFVLANLSVLWLLTGQVLYLGFRMVVRFGRIGERDVEIDLLDLRPVEPFARFGLRIALVVLASLALFFAPLSIQGFTAGYVWFALFLFPITALAPLALVVPSWGVHRQIVAAKRAEVARVQEAIAGNRAALVDSPLAREGRDLSVVELLTWRNEVAQIREWPFGAAALARFGLYLLIPVASWVGGALVERVVNAFFD